MANLEDIRKKLQSMENRKGGNGPKGPSLTYAFWNIPENETAVLRFLPDANEDNTFFWRERQLINLSFPGIKGQDENKRVVVKVPCMEMWGDTCPVISEIRPWWNDESLKENARQYWKKRSYMFQGFVVDDPLKEEEKPENPIRRFILGPQIFNIVKDALMDPDMENVPVDYINGTDFRITRTKKGQYSDYSTSKWARKESSLTEDQLEAIEKYGLFDLNDWLPARPNAEELNAIQEMFEASVDGELYDPDKWAKYYRPYGLEYNNNSNDSSQSKDDSSSSQKAEDKKEEKVEATPKTESKESSEEKTEDKLEVTEDSKPATSAQDILAKIKQRSNAE